MRKFYSLIFTVVLFGALQVNAQTTVNYAFNTNATSSLALDANSNTVDMTSGTTALVPAASDQGVSSVTNIGFDFYLNGKRYTQYTVSANGIIALGSTVVGTTQYTITGGSATTPFLSPLAADMITASSLDGGGVTSKVVGTYPNRCLVIQWVDYIYWNVSAPAATWQARLYESGAVEYVYGAVSTGTSVYPSGYQTGFGTNAAVSGSLGSITTSTNGNSTSAIATNTYTTSTAVANLNSASNGSRRLYSWTPVSTTAPTGLNFTAVTGTTTTLNWTDNASDEVGYVVYRSTDNVNFTYVTTTAANATNYAATGLSFGTTYYWKVYVLREALGSVMSSSQMTSAGTLSGIKTVGTGGDYSNLTTAFAAITTNGLAGNVDLQLITGYPAIAETFPILTSTAASVGPYTVKVYPTTVTVPLTITSASTTGTFNFNSGSNITIDGRVNATGTTKSITIANTATAGYDLQFINDASNNTIKYCTLTGVNTSTTSGTVLFGGSTGTTGNDGNTIDNCDILDGLTTPLNAIYSAGQSTTVDNSGITISNCNIANYFGVASASNGIYLSSNSSAWTITNNKFYQGATRTATTGTINRSIQINTASGGGYTITGNTIGYGASNGTGTTIYTGTVSRFLGMDITAANSPVSSIQGNTINNISVTSTSGGSTAAPIFGGIIIQGGSINVGNTTANTIGATTGTGSIFATSTTGYNTTAIYATSSGTVNIQNNNIGSITTTSATATITVAFNGILTAGTGVFTISGNNIGSATTANSIQVATTAFTTSTCSLYGVQNGSTGVPLNITGNSLYNATNYSTGTSSLVYGVYNTATTSGGTLNLNSNIIRNNSMISGTFCGIYEASSTSATTVVNANTNQIYSNTAVGTGATTIYGIRTTTSAFTNNNNQIYSNTITANAAAVTSTIYGIYNLSSPTSETITNNVINNLTIAGASTSTSHLIAGVYLNTAAGTRTISGNTINTLTFSNSTTGTATIHGIFSASSTPSIFKNKIYDLSAAGATSVVYGISVTSGNTNVNIHNNYIGDLKAPAGSNGTTDVIRGINLTTTTTTSNINLYYNTIYLSAAGGTNFTTSALYHTYSGTASTASLISRNNIIVNNSTPSGTGLTIAFRRSAATDLNNFSASSNNNDLYAGTPGASRLLFYDGTNAYQTLATYKPAMSTRDQAAVSENPTFVSTTGSAANYLHINTSTATQLESGGDETGLTVSYPTDYDGDIRKGSAGYPGTGTKADIGADEFEGTPSDLTGPTITYTALVNTCTPGANLLTATITDASTVPTTGGNLPVAYFKINSGSYSLVTGTSIGSNQYTFSIGAGSVAADVVSYYIVAQDNSAAANVSVFPSAGAAGITNNPPRATTAPTTPSSYTVLSSLSGTYSVGASNIGGESGHYATLTAAVAAYNSSCLSGNVIFALTDAAYNTSETFPLVLNSNASASSGNTLTIKPNTGVTSVITGSAAATSLIKLNGADYVTIDGSNNGSTSRNLSWISANTATSGTTVIWIASATASDGATNNTIKNCIITGNASTTTQAGIYSGPTAAVNTTSAALINNTTTTIQNNLISKAQNGIFVIGVSTASLGTGLSITNNNIGSSAVGDAVAVSGVTVQLYNAPVITGNDIQNITNTGSLGLTDVAAQTINVGLYLRNVTNANVSQNKIHNMNIGGSSVIRNYGMSIESPSFNTSGSPSQNSITNNLVYDTRYSGTGSSTWQHSGINDNGGYADKFYFNSVSLTGAFTTTSGPNAAFSNGNAGNAALCTNIDVRNNIFYVNLTAAGTTSTLFAHYTTQTTATGSTLNYNDLYAASAAGTAYTGSFNGSTRSTLINWQSATSQEGNSIGTDPQYVSTTVLTPNLGSPVVGAGVTGTGITIDYLGTARGTPPTIGAYETAADLAGPVITYTPLGTTCATGDRTLTATITDASGVGTGTGLPMLYYKINAGAYTGVQGVSIGSNQYTFTFGAAAVGGNTVSYYIAAQDLVATPNVSTFPAAGSGGYTVNPPAASTAPTTPSSYVLGISLNGTYSVGSGSIGGEAGHYTSLTNAVAAYNASCLAGPVIFALTDASYTTATTTETFPISISANTYANSTNTLTIKPNTGVTASVSGSSASGVIVLNGADYVIIDGSNSGGTTRNLTISNTATGASSSGVLISSLGTGAGATNDVVKNCNINTGTTSSITYGISAGTTAGVSGADNDNLTIQNNVITTASHGIYVNGTAAVTTGGNDNLSVTGNTVTTNVSTASFGIQLGNSLNASVAQNTLSVTTSASTQPVGISLETGFVSSTVSKNMVIAAYTSATGGYGGRGITIGTGNASSALTIVNNFVAGVGGSSNYSGFTNSSGMGIAIGVLGNTTTFGTTTGGVNLYHNSVNLAGNFPGYASGSTITAALYVGTATSALDIRNNIFVNTLNNQESTYGSGSKSYAFYSAIANTAFANINYNDYYAGGSQAVLGYLSGDQTSITALRTATAQDANSVNIAPVFTSATNLLLAGASNISLNDLGTTALGITSDIEGDVRPASGSTNPDMGADEFSIPACTGAGAGTLSASAASLCVSGTSIISAAGYAVGATATYQWQSSTDNFASNIVDIGSPSATYANYTTPTISSTMYYRLKVVCTAASLTGYSATPITITVTNPSVTDYSGGGGSLPPVARCGTGTVNLQATGSAGSALKWYAALTGGTSIGSGSPFTTPSISASTNYYVSAEVTSIASGTLSTGAGASTSSSAGTSPFYHGYGGAKTQYIYTGAELTALGLRAGNITGLSLNITSLGTSTMNGFSISIGNTAQSAAVANTAITTGLTTVYSVGAQTLTSGTNPYTFSTPFNWDGSSNIVISFNYSNVNTGGTSSTVTTDAAGFTSSLAIYADGTSAACLLTAVSSAQACIASSASSSTTTNRPKFIFSGQVATTCASTPRVTVAATVNTAATFTVTANQTICNGAVGSITATLTTPGDYDTYSWTPTTGLYQDAGGTTPYTGQNQATVYVKNTTAGATLYTCNASNTVSLCANTASSTVTVMPAATVTSSTTSICVSGTPALSLNPATGYGAGTIQWASSPDGVTYTDVPGATAVTYTPGAAITSTTWYQATIKNSAGSACASAPFIQVTVNNPIITDYSGKSGGAIPAAVRCGTGTLTLQATGTSGATINWYAAASGGTALATGSPFTTPSISATTNYYVSASTPPTGATVTVGPASPTAQGGTIGTQTTGWDVNFTTLVSTTIQSVDIFPVASGETGIIKVLTGTGFGGTVLATINYTTSVSGGTTAQTIPINYLVSTPGTYSLYTSTLPASGLKRNISGASYPYPASATIAKIIGNGYDPTYFMGMYNWQFSTSVACESGRTLVAATVTSSPAVTISADQTICNGGIGSITATNASPGDYDTYTWTPTTGLYQDAGATTPYTGQNQATVYVKNTTAGATLYTCNATNSVSFCATTASSTVTVMPNATVVNSTGAICLSGTPSLTLNPATGYGAGTIQWASSPDGVTYTDVPGATAVTYTPGVAITSTTWYRATLKNGAGSACASAPFVQVTVNNPTITDYSGKSGGAIPAASRCGTGTVNLLATGSGGGTPTWYAASSGGAALGTGSPFTTPSIAATTTYYVAQEATNAAAGNAPIGTQTTTDLGSSIFRNGYGTGDFRHQLLFTAAEMTTAGFTSGNITAFSVNITTAGVGSYNNYLIKMSNVSNTTNSTTFITPGAATTVFSSATYTPVTTGANTFTFSTPFTWDGSSSVLIDICYNVTSSNSSAYTAVNAPTNKIASAFAVTVGTGCTTTTAALQTYRPIVTFYGQIGSTCASTPRIAVAANVSASPAITLTADQTICNGGIGSITATPASPSDYDTYIWTPTTGLYQDAGATTPYTGQNQATVYVKNTTAGATLYTCNATNSVSFCAATGSSTVTVMPAPTVTSSGAICVSGTPSLSLNPATGYGAGTIQWSVSTDGVSYTDVSGATAVTYTPSSPITVNTYYKATIKNSAGSACASAPFVMVTVNNPSITDYSGKPGGALPAAYTCGTGTVNLQATGSAGTTLNWYAASSGGTPLGTGTSFTTPSISAATTYYVSASTGGSTFSGGRIAPTATSTFNIPPVGLVFTATTAFTLNSVDVYNNGSANTLVIQLQNSSGTAIYTSGTFNLPAATGTTAFTASLGWAIPVGTGYRLMATGGSANLVRETSVTGFPFALGSVGSVTAGYISGPTTSTYYDFYNWSMTTGCESTRTPVTASVYTTGTWTGGAGTTNWFTAGNWCGGVPGTGTAVNIPAGIAVYPTISSGNATANTIAIASGASLIVNSTGILSLYGSATTAAGGTFNLTNGTLDLAGGSATIGGSNILNATVGNLTISGNAAITSGATNMIKVTGNVSFLTSSNTLTTNNNLTLISNAAGTASVTDMTHNGATTLSGNSISGKVSVERYITTPRKWQFLSPMATAGTVQTIQSAWMEGATPGTHTNPASNGYGVWLSAPASAGPGYDSLAFSTTIKYWDATNQMYQLTGNPTTADIHGQSAYMLYVRGDRYATGSNTVANNTVLRTLGVPLQGTQSTITLPALNNTIASGNPYPSAVDLSKIFGSTSGGTIINLSVWDPKLTGSTGLGGFQYLRWTVGVANGFQVITPGGGSYGAAGSYMNALESGQGFFMQSSNANDIFMQFTEPAKTPSVHETFFTANNPQSMDAHLSVNNNSVYTVVDGLNVTFGPQYNSAADHDDALKLLNTNENISVKRDNILMAAELRGDISDLAPDTIRINSANLRSFNYQWKFDMFNMDAPGRAGFLIDQFTHTETPLNLAGTNTYDFTAAVSTPSAAADRFMIVFRPVGIVPVTITSVAANRTDAGVEVRWKAENELNIAHYEVERSANGTSFSTIITNVLPTNNAGGSASYLKLDARPLSSESYYRIRSVSDNGLVQYSAIVKVGPLTKDQSITLYPNPISDRNMNLRFANKAAGTYELQLLDKAGRTVYNGKVTVSTMNETRTVSLPGTLPAGAYTLVIRSENGDAEKKELLMQ